MELHGRQALEYYKKTLKAELDKTPLGMAWLPVPRIRLGREAGWAVRNVVLFSSVFFMTFACVRSLREAGGAALSPPARSPIKEIAYIILHKLREKGGDAKAIRQCTDADVPKIVDALRTCRKAGITSLRALLNALVW
eukprot:s3746_g3.t1